MRNRAKALQFFRWRKHVQQRHSKVVACSGHTLTAVTHEVGQDVPPNLRPIFPFDPTELPIDTAVYLKTIQRESPLTTAGIAIDLERSKYFTLKVQTLLADGYMHSMCTVYRCLITSIDGELVESSPSLCLKLFDDRFQPLDFPDEEDKLEDDLVHRWLDRLTIAQTYALNEASAYDKLQFVQGSAIPWFYGVHQVIDMYFDIEEVTHALFR